MTTTFLHKFAHHGNWNGFLDRLHTHPEEALLQVSDKPYLQRSDDDYRAEDRFLYEVKGVAPIHLVVTRQNPPVEVIRMLVACSPRSTQLLTADIRCALHYAMYTNKSAEIIRILVSADPETVSWRDFWKMNILHTIASFHCPKNVLSIVLQIASSKTMNHAIVCQDNQGRTPLVIACEILSDISNTDFLLLFQRSPKSLVHAALQTLCAAHRALFQVALAKKPVPKKAITNDNPTLFCNPIKTISFDHFWLWRPVDHLSVSRALYKSFILLGGNMANIAKYPLLHACINYDNSSDTLLFPCFLSLNPYYACQLHDHSLPIHLACQLAQNTDSWVKRLDALLRIYPQGASIEDGNNCLPLEILLQKNQKSWALIHCVLQCNPAALARVALPEQFYPILLERLQHSPDGISTIFSIFKETPTLIRKVW